MYFLESPFILLPSSFCLAVLDALTAGLADDFPAMLLIQSVGPDRFFGAAQQQRLAELMACWHNANDQGLTLPHNLQGAPDGSRGERLLSETIAA